MLCKISLYNIVSISILIFYICTRNAKSMSTIRNVITVMVYKVTLVVHFQHLNNQKYSIVIESWHSSWLGPRFSLRFLYIWTQRRTIHMDITLVLILQSKWKEPIHFYVTYYTLLNNTKDSYIDITHGLDTFIF